MTEPTPAEGVRLAIKQLFQPGQVVEVRVPKAGAPKKTISGYFDDFTGLERATIKLDKCNFPGIYYALNPVNPALLARATNRTQQGADATTEDSDIVRRRWFLIDVDPERPSGISASDAEKASARTVRMAIYQYLRCAGWPEPLVADSGNGYHLLYRIDLPNDDVSRDLLAAAIRALAAKFDRLGVKIDQTVFNKGELSRRTARWREKATPPRTARIAARCSSLIMLEPRRAWFPSSSCRPSPTEPSRKRRRVRKRPGSPRVSATPAPSGWRVFLNPTGSRTMNPWRTKAGQDGNWTSAFSIPSTGTRRCSWIPMGFWATIAFTHPAKTNTGATRASSSKNAPARNSPSHQQPATRRPPQRPRLWRWRQRNSPR